MKKRGARERVRPLADAIELLAQGVTGALLPAFNRNRSKAEKVVLILRC